MAKILASFDFGGTRGDGYNWDELLDGQCRQLTKGEDFDCKASTFGTLARNAAKKAGKSVRLSTVKEDGEEIGVVIQSFPMKEGAQTADEPQEQEQEEREPEEAPKPAAKKPAAGKKPAGKGK